MKTSHFLRALIAFTPLAALAAEPPQFKHDLKGAWLRADEANTDTAAVRFDFGVRDEIDVPSLSVAWFAETKGVVALKSRANPETISAQIGAETFRRFGGTVIVSTTPPANFDPTAAPPPIAPARAGVHDFLVGAGLKVGVESDQRFDNSQFTVGPRLSFTHTENDGIWPLLPSVYVAYQHVRSVRSRYLEQNGISDRTFWQLVIDASWKWRPFERTGVAADSALAPIGLHADVRYTQSYSLPAKAQALGLEEAIYTAGTISYGTERFGWKHVHDIYVTVAHGRIPPATRADTTIFVGVTLVR